MNKNKININKTKYRYLMDNLDLFPVRPMLKYTVPVPNDPTVDESKEEFFDRKYPEVVITNAKFSKMVDLTARALIAQGVKKGDIVTICHTNTPETLYMDYALNKIGAKYDYIYPDVTVEEMKSDLEELNSKYIFALDDPQIRKNIKDATRGMNVKVITSSPIESFPDQFKMLAPKPEQKDLVEMENEIKWSDFIASGKYVSTDDENKYVPNDVCGYVHTSGTSGVPKAVMITNENANSLSRAYDIDGTFYKSGEDALQTIPQFVEFGQATNQMLLCSNACLVIIPEMDPRNYYDLLKIYKPKYSYATPSHIRELIKRPQDMSNVEIFYFGGDNFAAVEDDINSYFKENGSSAVGYQGYSSTEMSVNGIITRPNAYKKGSLGKLSGDTKALIVDSKVDSETGKEILSEIKEPNKVGELLLTGSGVTKGYAGNSKSETEKVYINIDGTTYVRMGDYVYRDEDDFYYYMGRVKNIIKRKSFAFSPDEIVKAISKHPNVKDCVVVPRHSDSEGETPSAHIVLRNYENVSRTMNEIISLVDENVQEFHRPTDYKIREKLVITRNNKIDITALKIEDTISMYPGVKSVNIESQNDGNYDYQVHLETVNGITEDEVMEYLKSIANIMKFNVGKIKFIINYINYEDEAKVNSYVKHI